LLTRYPRVAGADSLHLLNDSLLPFHFKLFDLQQDRKILS
jgi:hypothetical protein